MQADQVRTVMALQVHPRGHQLTHQRRDQDGPGQHDQVFVLGAEDGGAAQERELAAWRIEASTSRSRHVRLDRAGSAMT